MYILTCVGKYLIMFAPLLLHRERTPSSLIVLAKQSVIPLYGSDNRPALIISSWFWIKSLTLSIGAAADLVTAADTPPMRKSIINLANPLSFSAGACMSSGTIGETLHDDGVERLCRPPLIYRPFKFCKPAHVECMWGEIRVKRKDLTYIGCCVSSVIFAYPVKKKLNWMF